MPGEELCGNDFDLPSFEVGDRVLGPTVPLPCSGLDLYEGDDLTELRHHVDLAASKAVVARKDGPTSLLQVAGGTLLSPSPQSVGTLDGRMRFHTGG